MRATAWSLRRAAGPGRGRRFALLGPLLLAQLLEPRAGGGDVAADLHVALVAGVFEELVVRVAMPRHVDLVRRGEHDRVLDPRLVADLVRPRRGEPFGQLH